MDTKYNEIFKLKELLEEAKIPHEFVNWLEKGWTTWEKYQIVYPTFHPDVRICSCIIGPHTYGGENGLLEIMGLLTDEELEHNSVVGHLTAEDVFNRIKKHHDGRFE